MKKTILLFTIAMLMMSSAACSDNSNLPDGKPQSSAAETKSSSEATSPTELVSENQSDTESTPETELDKFIKCKLTIEA